MIEGAIEYTANDNGRVGTLYREISYDDVKSYSNCKTSQIKKNDDPNYIEFDAIIKSNKYFVTSQKTTDGVGSIITSEKYKGSYGDAWA